MNEFTFCGYTHKELVNGNGHKVVFRLKDSYVQEGEIYVDEFCDIYILSNEISLKGHERGTRIEWRYDWLIFNPYQSSLYDNRENIFEYLCIVKNGAEDWEFKIIKKADKSYTVDAVDSKSGALLRHLFNFKKDIGISLCSYADFTKYGEYKESKRLFDKDGYFKVSK